MAAASCCPSACVYRPISAANSAPPFNITSGVDQYGRFPVQRPSRAFVPPGFTGPACTTQLANTGVACIASTGKYGSFVINPLPGMTVVPANYGSGFAQINVNMRISRTWGFGVSVTGNANQGRGGGGGGGGRGFGGGGRGPGAGGPPPGGRILRRRRHQREKIYGHARPLRAQYLPTRSIRAFPKGDLLSHPGSVSRSQLATAGQGATRSAANRRIGEFNLRLRILKPRRLQAANGCSAGLSFPIISPRRLQQNETPVG